MCSDEYTTDNGIRLSRNGEENTNKKQYTVYWLPISLYSIQRD